MRLYLAFVTTLCSLCLSLGVARGDICTPVAPAEGSSLPDFDPAEFTVDIEVATDEHPYVNQIMMYYSRPQNQLRLNTRSDKKKGDMFFYFSDEEALWVEYADESSRGRCLAMNITDVTDEMFLPGIKQNDKNIHVPLGILRMSGKSGFGGDIIAKKINQVEMRGMLVDKYESCQKIMRNDEMTTIKVTHYFSNDSVWAHPTKRIIPIALTVEGLKADGKTFKEIFSFFNVQFKTDITMLETPPGVFCFREKASKWLPPLPKFVQFSAEVIDKKKGTINYIEEVFSEVDKFAVMRINPQDQTKNENIIQDFQTGLCFLVNQRLGQCEIQNISACNNQLKLPFNMVEQNGKIRQLTVKEFFYANSEYHHVGVRQVRGVPCDAYVTSTNKLTYPRKNITAEWYFARGHTPPIPMKFRVWEGDDSEYSIDSNLYNVEYNELRFGVFNVKPCFPDRAFNHFRCKLVDMQGKSEINTNIRSKLFRAMTVKTLARQAAVIYWRIADLEFFFTGHGEVELEFEILDAPPYSGDMGGAPYTHTSLEDASVFLGKAIDAGLPLEVFDPKTGEMVEALKIIEFQIL